MNINNRKYYAYTTLLILIAFLYGLYIIQSPSVTKNTKEKRSLPSQFIKAYLSAIESKNTEKLKTLIDPEAILRFTNAGYDAVQYVSVSVNTYPQWIFDTPNTYRMTTNFMPLPMAKLNWPVDMIDEPDYMPKDIPIYVLKINIERKVIEQWQLSQVTIYLSLSRRGDLLYLVLPLNLNKKPETKI